MREGEEASTSTSSVSGISVPAPWLHAKQAGPTSVLDGVDKKNAPGAASETRSSVRGRRAAQSLEMRH